MKILMITPYLPYPLVSGGQIRTYNLLKKLKDRHEITLFAFIRRQEERQHVSQLSKFCHKIVLVERRPAWSFFNISIAGFSPFPFIIAIYYSRTVKKLLTQELKERAYDLIHAETFYTMPNLPRSTVPILLVEQTIEFLVYQHFVEELKIFFLKPLLYLDVLKIKLWEKYFWQKASRVVAMSQADQEIMKQTSPGLQVDIVPNGVDIEFFSSQHKEEESPPMILFVGNFSWLQNREAAVVLVKEVWPYIKKEIPEAKIWIVGRNPSDSIKKLASDSVIVDESQEDIRQAYRRASILVAPIKGGGGTRYKILEAMASRLPVITTSIGIEGLDAKDGREVIIRDDAKLIAQATVELLKDRTKYQQIADSAHLFVAQKYNWSNIANKLDRIYQEVASGRDA
ncbi:glycosyltransferase [Candidatus Daviesbacteria bacterium]|nr:glycosyltransferase [Candidatus Daviesbacteria bacterium]